MTTAAMLTHDQLGLTPSEHVALIEVRDLLRRETIEHEPNYDATFQIEPETQRHAPLFNMAASATTYECGSVACIGGNMRLIELGVDLDQALVRLTPGQVAQADRFVMAHKPSIMTVPSPALSERDHLTALFYPREIGTTRSADSIEGWEQITPAAAADAIDNYLTTGTPNWEQVAHRHQLQLNHDYIAQKRELGL